MEKTYLISIITVCLNSSTTIRKTFTSVLNQTIPNIEYIVVDGASTDGTVEIIKNYESRFSQAGIKFIWKSEPDEGLYDAMNNGIEMATGDYIGILNSDDYYELDACENVMYAIQQTDSIDIFYGFLRILHQGNEVSVHRYNYDYFLLNPHIGIKSGAQHPTCFVKKSVYQQIGLFDTRFRIAADYDFLIRAKNNGLTFRALDRVIANFSTGGISNTISDSERFKEQVEILWKNDLITKQEYKNWQKKIQYTRFKEMKRKLVNKIFGFGKN